MINISLFWFFPSSFLISISSLLSISCCLDDVWSSTFNFTHIPQRLRSISYPTVFQKAPTYTVYRLMESFNLELMLLCDMSSSCFTTLVLDSQTHLDYTIFRRTGHHDYASRIDHPCVSFQIAWDSRPPSVHWWRPGILINNEQAEYMNSLSSE